MLARESNPIGPCGLVASQVRSQARFATSSCSRARASRSRIGRMVTGPSRSVGMLIIVRQRSREVSQPRPEIGPQVVAIARELHDRLQIVEAIAGVIAAPAEHDAVHAAAPFRPGCELLQAIRQLNLAALAGLGRLEDLEDLGPQN